MRRTRLPSSASAHPRFTAVVVLPTPPFWLADRKSTRNSSHSQISYAVFCLKKKNEALGLIVRDVVAGPNCLRQCIVKVPDRNLVDVMGRSNKVDAGVIASAGRHQGGRCACS